MRHTFSDYRVFFPPCDKAYHSPSCNLEVKNEWSCTSSPPCAFKICTRTVLPLRIQVSWDVTLRFSAFSCRRFEGTTIFPDVRDYTPDDIESRPRKLEFSATPLSENKISQPIISFYNTNRSVFIIESNCVFCEVGSDFFVSNVDEVYFRSYIKNTVLRNTHTRFPGH